MKYKLLFSLALISSFTFFYAQEDSYSLMLDAVKNKDYKKALKINDQLLLEDSLNVDYLSFRAYICLDMEEYECVFQSINKAIEYNPTNPSAYLTRGIILSNFREFEQSIDDYSRAIELCNAEEDTLKYVTYSNRAGSKMSIRDFEGAYKDLMKSYEFDSTDVVTLSNLGMVSDELGQANEALIYLKKTLFYDSTFDMAYTNIGFIYQGMKQYELSNEYFDLAIKIDPLNAFAYNNRAYNKLMQKDLKGAMKDVNQSLKIADFNSYAYRNRALIYLEMNKVSKACEDLQKALEYDFTKNYGDEVLELKKKHCK